jgi:cobalt-zinc-cadmium efflux system protein
MCGCLEATSRFPSLPAHALSAHVIVGAETDCHEARFHLGALLEDRFGISHSTFQVEHVPTRLLKIE